MKSRRQFWNKVAPKYGKFMRNNQDTYDEASKLIGQYLSKDSRVLELACGTGQFTFNLCQYVDSYTATDFSSEMIKHCIAKNSDSMVNFELADATQLCYDSGSFDVVVVANALHCMPDPAKALAEISRVLKPNGLLIAPTFVIDQQPSKLRMFILNLIGFKTYNNWTSVELSNFVKNNSFDVVKCENIMAKPLVECVLVAKKVNI
ncbi:MAG: class I SAM-dependent methyltransferase [Bacillota bacterium]